MGVRGVQEKRGKGKEILLVLLRCRAQPASYEPPVNHKPHCCKLLTVGNKLKHSLCWSAAGWSVCQTLLTSPPSCRAEHRMLEVLLWFEFPVTTHPLQIRAATGRTTGIRLSDALFELFVLLKSRCEKCRLLETQRRRGPTGHMTPIQEVCFRHGLLAICVGCVIKKDTAANKKPLLASVEKLLQSTYPHMAWITAPNLWARRRTDGEAFVHFTLHFHLFTSERKSFAFRISNLHQVWCIAIATSTTRSTFDRDLDCVVVLFSRHRMDSDEELQQFPIGCPDVSTLI